jgi:hypothetical protein
MQMEEIPKIDIIKLWYQKWEEQKTTKIFNSSIDDFEVRWHPLTTGEKGPTLMLRHNRYF